MGTLVIKKHWRKQRRVVESRRGEGYTELLLRPSQAINLFKPQFSVMRVIMSTFGGWEMMFMKYLAECSIDGFFSK